MSLKMWMQKVNEIIPVRWWSKAAGVPVSYLNELKRGSKDNPSLSHLQVIARSVGHDVYILPRHAQDHQYHLYPYLLHLMNAWVQVSYGRVIWIEDVAEGEYFLDEEAERDEMVAECEKALDILIFLCNEFDCSAMEFILQADKQLQNFDPTEKEQPMVEWPFRWAEFSIGLLCRKTDPHVLSFELELGIFRVLSLMRYLGVEVKDVLNGTDRAFYPTEYEAAIQRCENSPEVPSTDAGSQATPLNG